MKRNALKFDIFAFNCGYLDSNSPVNNGLGCSHLLLEETDEANGTEYGCCFCWSCPLGREAKTKDLHDPSIDWGGMCSDGAVPESEYILVDAVTDDTEDADEILKKYWLFITLYRGYGRHT